jgi:hypothetical protein
MNTFSDRLNMLMAEKPIEKSPLAKELKISYQAVRKAVLGGAMERTNSDKAADFFGVNRDWLYSGAGKRDDPYGTVQRFELKEDLDYPTEIKMLAKTFSLIPENDEKARTLAYNAASAAIMRFVKTD